MNSNYSKIIQAGFDIEIRSQQFSMAQMYLILNGKRTGHSVLFKSGHFSASSVMAKVKGTRKDTHLDSALRELASVSTVAAALATVKERDYLEAGSFSVGSLSQERTIQNVSSGAFKI